MTEDVSKDPDGHIRQVVHAHTRLLYRIAYGIVRSHSAAEDLCQDAMLTLVKNPCQLRDAGKVRPWLVRTVTNAALLHLRRRRTENETLKRLRPADVDSGETDDVLMRQKLCLALEQLDEEVRGVVVLRVMEGLSGGEVQELLGLSPSDVSRKLHAGLHRLRLVLREHPGAAEKMP